MNALFISKDTVSKFDNDMQLLDRYHKAITLLDIYHLSGIIDEKEHTRIRQILDSPDSDNITVGEAILENYKNTINPITNETNRTQSITEETSSSRTNS